MKPVMAGALLALATTTAGGAENRQIAIHRYIYSANNTLAYCKAYGGPPDANISLQELTGSSYCSGMLSMLFAMAPYTQGNDKACISIPVGASSTQAAKVIVRYGETHPDRLHLSLETLAIEALHNAWPCR
jgi:hypothetical protein